MLLLLVNVQGCGAQTNIAVIVIRLDATPASPAAAAAASTAAAAVPQQKHPAPSEQVRESRDRLDDVTDASASPVVVASAASTAGESSDDFVRSAISIEGARRARAPRSTGPPTSTPATTKSAAAAARQRFVKKAAGARDVELRQASPSSSLSSGSSSRPPSRADETPVQSAAVDRAKEGLPAATDEPADSAASVSDNNDVVQLSSSSTDVGLSVQVGLVAACEQRPTSTSSDSSTSLSSVGGVTPTSVTGARQRPPAPSSSEDGRPPSAAGTSPVRRPRRRSPVTNPGKFRLNTSVAPPPSVTSPAAATEPSDEQGAAVDDEEEEPVFDVTRL